MATVLRTNINTVLAALAAQIVARGVVPSLQFCYAVDDDNPELTQAQVLILLRPRGETPVRGVQEAAGRVDRRVRRKLSVLVYTQLNLDQTGRATATSFGHFAAEDNVIDALDTFQPVVASTGDALTYEPVAWLGLSESRRNAEGWARSVLDFDVPYIRALDQTIQ